ncbi:hypothetical protein LTR85_002445 [Meristemomyces frigidus]|nr:hypothetical protein LTR85_002445 [Meristemomyces frigidus]
MAGNDKKRSPTKRKPARLDIKEHSSLSPTAPSFQFPGSAAEASVYSTQPLAEPNQRDAIAEQPPRPKTPNLQPLPTPSRNTVTSPFSPKSARALEHSRNISHVPATPTIEESDSNKAETNAEARLAKQKNEFDDVKKDWYDRVSKAEEEAEEATKKLKKAEEEKTKLKNQAEGHAAEVKSLSKQLDGLKREKEQKLKQKHAKVGEAKDHDEHIKALQDELANALSDLQDEQAESKKLREQNDEYEAKRSGLHQEIDDLTKARDDAIGASKENNEAREMLVEINAQFEQMFENLGEGLSMNDYIDHVRSLQHNSRLRRDDSRASMASDFGEPQAGRSGRPSNRQVSSASMAEELQGAESGNDTDDDVEDQDPTMNGGHLFASLQIKHDGPQSDGNPVLFNSFDDISTLFGDPAHEQTLYPDGDDLNAGLLGTGTTVDAGTSVQGMIKPWNVTHGDEGQSVRNPALPGQVDKFGEDEFFGEWEHKSTQTPSANAAASAVPQSQKLSFSGIMQGVSTAPIAPVAPVTPQPQPQPAAPAPVQSDTDTVKQLRTQIGTMKMLLEQRDKNRNTFWKANQKLTEEKKAMLEKVNSVDKLTQEKKDLQQKLSSVDKEMQALRQTRAPAPAPVPVPPTATTQALGFSGTQSIANIPPTAPPQAATVSVLPTATNQGLSFSGTQSIANIRPTAPTAPPQVATVFAPPYVGSNRRRIRDATTQTPPGQPQTQQQRPPRVVTVTVEKVPQSLPELFRALPWWLQLLLGLLTAFLAFWTACVIQERHLWLTVNDQMHEELVRLTGPSSRYGWLLEIEEWMGVDRQGIALG